MKGRPRKVVYPPIYREIPLEFSDGGPPIPIEIRIRCPVCGSTMVSTNGTQRRKEDMVETFICRNPNCEHLKTHKYGKQFVATTSYDCKMLFASVLHDVINDLLHKNAPKSFIAEKYGVSPPIISYIMKKLHGLVDDNGQYRELVRSPTEDIAIGIDETFVKIRRKTIYIIMAVGYTSHKILGLLVSERRTEKELRQVFDEANRNTRRPIEVVTSDAWGATRKMIKGLNYPITHIVHVHKKPYKDVYIWHYEYSGGKRYVLEIGIKADFFKKRAKRRIYIKIYDEPLNPPAKKKRGRPKGSKNKKKRSKQKKTPNNGKKKKRGRKGLRQIFSTGQVRYVKCDPYKARVKLLGQQDTGIIRALNDGMDLFGGISVQNNISESINSFLRLHFKFRGPRTIKSLEAEIRLYAVARNNMSLIDEKAIEYSLGKNWLNREISIKYIGRFLGGVQK